ncbi:RNA polymerase II elongation factor ELL3 [Monodelphis domestica]|uniref:RNA polymerase II elongation factor ELL3 n=1 Tax=Monodelphis domestica TaxID=13616 RepID=UPI0024E21BB7|nr:RNA polymerase II elongation factor ELL3 [Monodelphis domestica]
MAGPQEALSGRLRLSFAPGPRTSFLLLRLNDSALRALQDCQRIQAQPVITFQGNRGYLRLPGPGCSCLFSFIVSQCGADGPRGGLDLVRHRLGRSGPGLLQCLGPLRERITICSAVDFVPVSSSLRGHQQDEGAGETGSQHSSGLDTKPQPQLEEVRPGVLDPLDNNQEAQPGSSRDHRAQWGPEFPPHKGARSEILFIFQPEALEHVSNFGRQYGAIHNAEQCHVYEKDFEADYAEYRALHARVGAVSRRFMQLGMEIKRVQRGTPEHKVLEDKIVQEYRKFRKRCPGYKEEKQRCEYLHQKLSHIKSLILEFEKNRDS